VRDVTASDVNDYLKQITGQAFTAKDFRTWAGTVLAANALAQMELADSKKQTKANIVRAIEHTAAQLGNTVAICRKCYVHPAVLNAYIDGTLKSLLEEKIARKLSQQKDDLAEHEQSVLRLLRHSIRQMKTTKAA
jgi:DNA topoisomerase I